MDNTEYVHKSFQLKSKAELKTALLLDFLNIKYEYEPTTFILPTGEFYTPDFWCEDIGYFIEVKSGVKAERLHKPFQLGLMLSSLSDDKADSDYDWWCRPRTLRVALLHDHNLCGMLCPSCGDQCDTGLSWAKCAQCMKWSIWDECAGWLCRMCGVDGKDGRNGGQWYHDELYDFISSRMR